MMCTKTKLTEDKKITGFLISLAIMISGLMSALLAPAMHGDADFKNKGMTIIVFLLIGSIIIATGNVFNRRFLVWYAFIIFIIIASFYQNSDFFKAVGGEGARQWWFVFFAFLTGYMVNKRKQLMVFLLNIYAFISCFEMVSAIITGTVGLFNGGAGTGMGSGLIKNGRLNAFGSSNSLGIIAATTFLAFLWLFFIISDYKYRKVIRIIYACGMMIAVLSLSLARSRGAIFSTAISIGVFVFIYVLNKWRDKALYDYKRLLVAVLVAALTVPLAAVVCYVPGKIYNKAVNTVAEKKLSDDSRDNLQGLLTSYGVDYALDTLSDRTLIWPATIRMMVEEPQMWIIGTTTAKVGHVQIRDVYENRPERTAYYAHNGYVQALFDYGVPGAFLLLIMLLQYAITCFRLLFGKNQSQADIRIQLLLPIALLAVVWGMVEVSPFPYTAFFPSTFFFFTIMGVFSGEEDEVKKNIGEEVLLMKKNYRKYMVAGVAVLALISGFTALGYLLSTVHNRNEMTGITVDKMSDKERPDFVLLNNEVNAEMMDASFWIDGYSNSGIDLSQTEMTGEEIAEFNVRNRRMISTNEIEFNMSEIGELFNGKVLKHLLEDTGGKPSDPDKYILNGVPTTTEYWDELERKVDIENLPKTYETKFGYSVDRTVLKKFPTDDSVYESGDSLYYDYMVQSDLLPFMPVAVVYETADGEWFYVLTYGYGGWVRKEYIAICESREDWLARQNPENFIVVTGREIRISTDPYHEELSDTLIPMGTVLPIVSVEEALEDDNTIHERATYGNYITKLPVRAENGMISDCYVLIPASEDVNFGFLPYTQENVLKLAFKLLGTEYGWGGDNNAEDCSGLTREIYACFGFNLPRSAIAQTEVKGFEIHNVTSKSVYAKQKILDEAPAGTLIYFPGHIMLYVGSVNGEAYCMSAVGSFATCDMEVGESAPVNTVILTNMYNTTRKTGASWLESAEKIVICK